MNISSNQNEKEGVGALVITIIAVIILIMIVTDKAYGQYLQPIAPATDPLKEYRQCGMPERNADGTIKRRAAVTTAYKRIHPCPVTGLSTGPCPGWQMNHIIPLASGGCDAVINIQWIPIQIKTCKELWCIDRWERNYYHNPHRVLVPF